MLDYYFFSSYFFGFAQEMITLLLVAFKKSYFTIKIDVI